MSTFRATAITLSKRPFREADRLYSFYTEEAGKVVAVCQGARKIASKLSGHLEFFGVTEMLIVSGKNIDRVAGAERLHYFDNVALDSEKIISASRFLSFADRLTKPGVRDKRVFECLTDFLKILNDAQEGEGANLELLKTAGYLRLLSLFGYTPEFNKCADCGQNILEDARFQNGREGFFCHLCAERALPRESFLISGQTLQFLRDLTKKELRESAYLTAFGGDISGAAAFIGAQVNAHLDLRP